MHEQERCRGAQTRYMTPHPDGRPLLTADIDWLPDGAVVALPSLPRMTGWEKK